MGLIELMEMCNMCEDPSSHTAPRVSPCVPSFLFFFVVTGMCFYDPKRTTFLVLLYSMENIQS